MKNADTPANPHDCMERVKVANSDLYEVVNVTYPGLTKREYACIKLRIPKTGDQELDTLITEARRRDDAAKAMQGILANSIWTSALISDDRCEDGKISPKICEQAISFADALIKELES